MKNKSIILLIALIFAINIFADNVSIYDIQYTTESNGNSPYDGQVVTTTGIVTGFGFPDDKYFISAPEGGAWNGIYVYDYTNNPNLGDEIEITGKVDEYYNLTELTYISAFAILSSGNLLPEPVEISTQELASEEKYEGVLVQINSVTITQTPNSNNEWYVTDGTGECQIDDGFYHYGNVSVGDSFNSIIGIVDYNFGNYGLNPRDSQDFVTDIQIQNITYSPDIPLRNDNILVKAEVISFSGSLSKVEVIFWVANDDTTKDTLLMETADSFNYITTIPNLNSLTDISSNINFFIRAENSNLQIIESPEKTIYIHSDDNTTIEQIQTDINFYNGKHVELLGVVTIGAGVTRLDKLSAYFQDASGFGIQLYGNEITSQIEADIAQGNLLKISGTVDDYNGTTELTDISYEVIKTGVSLDNYVTLLSLAEVQTESVLYEGSFVEVSGNVTSSFYAGGGTNISFGNGEDEITVRVWDSAGINCSSYFVGDNLRLRGIISSYNNEGQLVPGYSSDIANFTRIPQANITLSNQTPLMSDSVQVIFNFPNEKFESYHDKYLYYKPESSPNYTKVVMENIAETLNYQCTLPRMDALSTAKQENYVFYIKTENFKYQTIKSSGITIQTYSGYPVLSDIEIDFDNNLPYPFLDEPITFEVNATDPNGEIKSVKLSYGFKVLSKIDTLEITSGNNYSVTIDSLYEEIDYTEDLLYKIVAIDTTNKITESETMILPVCVRAPIINDFYFDNLSLDTDSLIIYTEIELSNIIDTTNIIKNVTLNYSIDYKKNKYSLNMEIVDTLDANTKKFKGIITGLCAGESLELSVYAEDNHFSTNDYPGNKEFLLSYTSPVTKHEAILKVPPHPFNPYDGETIKIDYYSKQGDQVVLRIYNAEGKLIYTPIDEVISAPDGINNFEWDGKDRTKSTMPLGLYICYLEVKDVKTGKTKKDKVPIVIGAPLK